MKSQPRSAPKALRQARRAAPPAVSARVSSRVSAHVLRPSFGRRPDAHEREAHELANRFVSGELQLAGAVSAAPAARFWLPGSVSTALPETLRESLEQAFSADLHALRIHADAPAATSAAAIGARAYASGAHLVFGAGLYRPDTPDGQRLIAHEVVHALQQAARAGDDGALQVVEVDGTAPPQCDDIPDFDTLKAAHAPAAAHASRPAYDTIAATLAGLEATPDPGASLTAYVTELLPTLKGLKWPHHAESLLYDTCKRRGLFDLAAQLIERDDFVGGNRINTIGLSVGVFDSLEARNGGWAVYAKAIASVGWLKGYETELLSRLEDFTMGVTLAGTVAQPHTKAVPGDGALIYDHLSELKKQIIEYTTVSHNEWVYRGLMLMYDLDAQRASGCVGIYNQSLQLDSGEQRAPFAAERYRAQGVIDWGTNLSRRVKEFTNVGRLPDAEAASTALGPYLRKLGDRASEIGRKALAIWSQAVSLDAAVDTTDDAATQRMAAMRTLAAPLGQKAGVPALLAGLLRNLNSSDAGGRLLDSVMYRERVNAWLPKLDDLRDVALAAGRLAAFRAGRTDEARAWIAIDAFVRRVRSQLIWTASESVKTDAGSRAPVSSPEEANFFRIQTARWLRRVCEPLGWSDVKGAADEILTAQLEAASVLAIRSYDDGEVFKRHAMAPEDTVTQARTDFGTHALRGLQPLTLDTLALFYRAVYYEDLAQQLKLMLPGSDKAEQAIVKANAAVPYLANDAKKALKYEPPQRWRTLDAQFAQKAQDKRDFGDLLRAHPAFVALEHDHKPPGFISIVPVVPGAAFTWFIPPFDAIYPLLRASLVFQGFVAASFSASQKPEQRFKQQEGLSDQDWTKRLQTTFSQKLADPDWVKNEWPGVLNHLFGLALGQYTNAVAGFRTQFTWAMRRDRQLIAKRLIVRFIAYDADHHDRPAIRGAVQDIGNFNGSNSALEDFDRMTQLGLLMLEVAPEINTALANEESFDVVFPMLGFAEQGLWYARSLTNYPATTRTIWLPEHENTDAWINARLIPLQATVDHLRAVRDAVQKSQGFKADKDKQNISVFVKLSSPLPVFTLMQPRYNGFLGDPSPTAYRVLEVVRSFIYHPAYGDPNTPFQGNAPSGHAGTQFLEADGKTNLAAGDADVLLRVQVVRPSPGQKKGAPTQWETVRQIDLTRKDEALFHDLYNGALWAGFASAMGNIQAGIESVLEFYLDAAELLPGVGPAIAAARIVAALTEFLSSADYEAMIDACKGGFKDVVVGLFDAISAQMDADRVILLLLFGDPRLEMLLASSTLGRGKAKQPADSGGGSGRFGVLKKVMDSFRRLGRAVFKALRELDRYVERPMQDMRVFGSTRPLLSFSLQFAADHIFQIVKMAQTITSLIAGLDKAGGDKALMARLEADIKLQQQGFGQRLHDVLHSIANFKLPHEVVDITPAIAAVLTVAEGYVIKRTGFAGKVINLALKHSGAYDFINTAFAKAIVDAGADPNIYWRETVLPKIETQFNTARDELVASVNAVLTSPTFKGVFDTVPDVQPMKVETDTSKHFDDTAVTYVPSPDEAKAEAAADTAPLPSDDRPLVPHPGRVPEVGAGQPLTAPQRLQFEQRLGQDVSHVRLHTGAAGDAMTSAFGADALTTGSHVFVRGDNTEATLDHELVHVLQQTGPRPLGRPHDPAPVRGHPERGLDLDPRSEAEANAVAAAMRSGGPVSAGGGAARAAGLQPTGVNWFTVARLMREVSNLEKVTATAKAIDAAGAGTLLSKENQTAVDKVLAVLKSPSGNVPVWKYPGPFAKALPLIESRLSSTTYADVIARGAEVIAKEALEPATAAQGQPQFVSVTHFERHLEAYVLAKTGIAVALTLRGRKVPVAGIDVNALDLSNPVEKISLVHIHLPYIDGRSPIWGKAIDNTWPAQTPDFRTRMRHAVRPLLESKGIQPGIWPLFGQDFRFSLFFTSEAEKYLKSKEAEKPDPVPSWQDYVKTGKAEGGDVGLRLAHYNHASQRGKGRQSHHLTQFLVAEFFANSNDSKAFDGTRRYPGVRPVGAAVSKAVGSGSVGAIADKDSGGAAIDVDTTKGKDRGGAMPTISLAAVTHQKGKLHVTPEADESIGGSVKTQGTAMKNEFQRRLPPDVVSPNANTFQAYVTKRGNDVVAGEIYSAVQQTYAAVEHHMSSQLDKNMAQLEYQYYTGLVEGTSQDLADATNQDIETPAQKQFKASLAAIPAIARKHNEDEMLKFGWKVRG